VGLESARRKMPGLEFDKPLYHRIPRRSLPKSLASAGNMIVMAIPITVHVNGSRLDGKTYYLCAQLDSAEGLPITAATFETGREGPGSQLHITYRVRDDVRKGLVWLK